MSEHPVPEYDTRHVIVNGSRQTFAVSKNFRAWQDAARTIPAMKRNDSVAVVDGMIETPLVGWHLDRDIDPNEPNRVDMSRRWKVCELN
jgi:hypothetical protein